MSYAPIFDIFVILWLAVLTFFCAKLVLREKKNVDPRVLTLMRQFGELQIQMSDLESLYDRLLTSHKRLRASAGMRALRDKQTAGKQEESEAEILARLGLRSIPK